jgi:hypothetical protein
MTERDALNLTKRMLHYEQHGGAEGYEVTLYEYRLARRTYPLTMALALDRLIRERQADQDEADADRGGDR